MREQLLPMDPGAFERKENSKLAEDQLPIPKLQYAMARMFAEANTPLTAREAAQLAVIRFGGEVESYRKRVHELRRKGVLEYVGSRRCDSTGKRASIYRRSKIDN